MTTEARFRQRRKKLVLFYSGPQSAEFWRRVAQDGRMKMYRAACRLQELETEVVRSLPGVDNTVKVYKPEEFAREFEKVEESK
jgi:hypothetical protein